MTILSHLAPPCKGGGVGMGQYVVLAPQGQAGMGLIFLSPPSPHPTLIRTIIVNLVNLKSLIFKLKHKTWDKIFFILIPTTTATL